MKDRAEFEIGRCSLCGGIVVAVQREPPPVHYLFWSPEKNAHVVATHNRPRCKSCGALSLSVVAMEERRDTSNGPKRGPLS